MSISKGASEFPETLAPVVRMVELLALRAVGPRRAARRKANVLFTSSVIRAARSARAECSQREHFHLLTAFGRVRELAVE